MCLCVGEPLPPLGASAKSLYGRLQAVTEGTPHLQGMRGLCGRLQAVTEGKLHLQCMGANEGLKLVLIYCVLDFVLVFGFCMAMDTFALAMPFMTVGNQRPAWTLLVLL